MTIVKNPFGVGESGDDLITKTAHCECCQLLFSYQTARHSPREQSRCPHCVLHDLDGTAVEQIDALREHEPRLRSWLNEVYDKANQQEQVIKQQRIELHDRRTQVAEALQTRDRHRDIAAAALSVHRESAPGRCRCGLPHPCTTTRAVDEFDRKLAVHLRRQRMPQWFDDEMEDDSQHCPTCTCQASTGDSGTELR